MDEYIENPIIEFEQTPPSNKKKNLLRSLHIPILIIFIAGTIYFTFTMITRIYMNKRAKMPVSHIYVCDNPAHKSDFDTWLSDELGIDWVPTYIIIKNNIVLGQFPGAIPESEFSTKLAMCTAYDLELNTLPNYEISNLKGERDSLHSLFGDGTYILELHWIDCEDCQYQDEYYTDDIYAKYGTSNFYRYYIKSDKEKVKEKYVND